MVILQLNSKLAKLDVTEMDLVTEKGLKKVSS